MLRTMTVIRPSGEAEVSEVAFPDDGPGFARLDELIRALLDGGDLERVNVWHDGGYTDMFVDGRGIEKGLPVNAAATKIYQANVRHHQPGVTPLGGWPEIHGTAVLFSDRVWF